MNRFFIEIHDTKNGIKFHILHKVKKEDSMYYSQFLEIDKDSYDRILEKHYFTEFESFRSNREIFDELGILEFMI